MSNLAARLAGFFETMDYQWKLADGSTALPSEQDMQTTLDKIAERVENEPDGTILTVGRLLVNKQPEGLEVYVYFGDYDAPVHL